NHSADVERLMILRDLQKRPNSVTPRTRSTTPNPDTAPRTKLLRSSPRRCREYPSRTLCSQSADQGTNTRKRPISKQKRMKATARKRFITFGNSGKSGTDPNF